MEGEAKWEWQACTHSCRGWKEAAYNAIWRNPCSLCIAPWKVRSFFLDCSASEQSLSTAGSQQVNENWKKGLYVRSREKVNRGSYIRGIGQWESGWIPGWFSLFPTAGINQLRRREGRLSGGASALISQWTTNASSGMALNPAVCHLGLQGCSQ